MKRTYRMPARVQPHHQIFDRQIPAYSTIQHLMPNDIRYQPYSHNLPSGMYFYTFFIIIPFSFSAIGVKFRYFACE